MKPNYYLLPNLEGFKIYAVCATLSMDTVLFNLSPHKLISNSFLYFNTLWNTFKHQTFVIIVIKHYWSVSDITSGLMVMWFAFLLSE